MPDIIDIDNVMLGRTPFNAAALNHGYSGYIGSRERRAMNEMALNASKTVYPETTVLVDSLKQLTNEDEMWDIVIKHLQNPATANTHMELVLASCNVIALYGTSEDDRSPLPRYDLHKQGKDLNQYQLTGWYLNPVPRDLDNLRTFVNSQVKERKRLRKKQLAKEFSDIFKQYEEQRKLNLDDRDWLVSRLTEYGVKIDEEFGYKVDELRDMFVEKEELSEQEQRLATMAPLPNAQPPPVFD